MSIKVVERIVQGLADLSGVGVYAQMLPVPVNLPVGGILKVVGQILPAIAYLLVRDKGAHF